ncbi:hypothetical protein NIES2104_17030 [Leptolyngbya sp. NIES-2104]|nr:hypothetical protein NIES2104_17030 [Leptolyngbya sp. NIES-2104]
MDFCRDFIYFAELNQVQRNSNIDYALPQFAENFLFFSQSFIVLVILKSLLLSLESYL